MHDELEISSGEVHGRAVLLRIKGHLDARTAPLLIQRAAAIQENGQNLVLSLAEVRFLGSGGIGALLLLMEQFQEQAGSMRLAALSPEVEAVLKFLNLDQILAIDPSEEESLAALV